ncbi:MAG: hypothetical protein GX804_07305 [Lentisphaerae bacterium]|nr:hypothetical protein [Lentisphaerota bacterium]
MNKVVGIIVAAQNVTIKNTKIHDFVGALIRPDGAHNLLIEDCTLYNSSAFGIYPISKSDNVTIKGCYLAGSNGIRIYKNGTGWVIDGNYIAGRHNWDESVKFPF